MRGVLRLEYNSKLVVGNDYCAARLRVKSVVPKEDGCENQKREAVIVVACTKQMTGHIDQASTFATRLPQPSEERGVPARRPHTPLLDY
jgi:hypothetical protein